MNYLELCQDFVSELGIEGGDGPSAVTGQTGELGNVVRWIRDADRYICNLHQDWKFLWVRDTSLALTIGSDVLPDPAAPNLINVLDRGSVWLNRGTATARRLRYMPWTEFRRIYHDGVVKQTARPNVFSIKPDRSMVLDTKADDTDAVSYEYWKRHELLVDNDDEPLIPEQFQRLIIVKAKLAYAEREDAPEIAAGASAEYTDLLEKMEAQEWPGNEHVTMSSASDDAGAGEIVVSPE